MPAPTNAKTLLLALTLCAGCADESTPALDGVPADGALPEAGQAEAGQHDAGQAEAGQHDAGQAEAGQHDAGAGAPDSGPDAAAEDAALGRDSGTAEPRFPSKQLASPPSYQGSRDNRAACSTRYQTVGFVPDSSAGTRHPLFLYFTGTAISSTDLSSQYDNVGALKVAEAMARRGFVALSAAYDNTPLAWLSDHTGQLSCLFDSKKPASLLAAACALPEVDCSLGIATWGHSLGGYVAHMAFNSDARVRGSWATGYGGEASANLSKHRLRVVNGEADGQNGTASSLNVSTGLSAAECTQPDQCLRPDGSGWIIVRARELQNPGATADHCWFDRASCSATALVLEPSWIDPNSSKSFALEVNADWLARTVRNTQLP